MKLNATMLAMLLAFSGLACHSEAPDPGISPDVANGLQVVAEGAKKDLVYKAKDPGTIIASNFTQGGTIYKGPIKAGETFTLLTNADHALIGKTPVHLDLDTDSTDTYRLYFLKD